MNIGKNISNKPIIILSYVLAIITIGLYVGDPSEKSVKFSIYMLIAVSVIALIGFKDVFLSYLLHCIFLAALIIYYFIA